MKLLILTLELFLKLAILFLKLAIVGLVYRHISTRSYQVYRRIGIRLIGLCSHVYWHEACHKVGSIGRLVQCLIIIMFLVET